MTKFRTKFICTSLLLMTSVMSACRTSSKSNLASHSPGTLASSGEGAPLITAKDGFFFDAHGRTLILRGVNVAGNSKMPPFMPLTDMNQFDQLQKFGMNVVRLLFIWEAYETAPGVYNAEYLSYWLKMADAAWQRGMYVIADLHQDGFARTLGGGCGEGFPQWAVPTDAETSPPDNGPNCANWAVKIAKDVNMHYAWNQFFHDAHEVRTRFLAMLKTLASQCVNHPGIIGYDLLNEPWGVEGVELAPLYEDEALAIRAIHPHAIMFIEGHISTNAGLQTNLPRPSFTNFAYAPHFYDPVVMTSKVKLPGQAVENHAFSNMTKKAREWQAPLFLGEYGMPADVRGVGSYMNIVYSKLDETLASGAQWVWTPHWSPTQKDGWNTEDVSITDDQGNIRANFQVRPYPRAVAGKPLTFAVSEKEIQFSWYNNPALGDTELFVPEQGPWHSVVDATGVDCTFVASKVTCHANASARVSIVIK